MKTNIKQRTVGSRTFSISAIRNIFLIAIIVAGIYSCTSKKVATQNNKVVDSMVSVVNANVTNNLNLQSQYNGIRMQVDDLLTKNMRMDTEIARKNREIAGLHRKLEAYKKENKLYASEVTKAKSTIGSLKDETRGYSDRIGFLQSEKDAISGQFDSLLSRYISLKKLGSVLHASNIRLTAIQLKHNGTKEKKTVRARKVNVLRINFDIDENRIAEDGTKDLYLVIKNPDGRLLEKDVAMSEMLKTSTGSKMKYSFKKSISLRQGTPVADILVDWKQDADYKKGNYDVAIYNGGYEIGKGMVALK